MSSLQLDLGKNKPPRVHIFYQVHTGKAIEKKELPFVVGVLADLSGASRKGLPRLTKRDFVEIKRDTFDKVLARIRPTVEVTVPNLLQHNDTDLRFKIEFTSMADFHPVAVAQKIADKQALHGHYVEPFAKLLELRRQIKRLLTSMDGDDAIQDFIQRLINKPDSLKQLCDEAAQENAESEEGRS
jgi:type VI secretion system protein ImpB